MGVDETAVKGYRVRMPKKLSLAEWIASSNDHLRPDGDTGHGAISDLADAVGVHRTHISRVVHGHVRPSVDLAKAISKATRGAVRVETLLELD